MGSPKALTHPVKLAPLYKMYSKYTVKGKFVFESKRNSKWMAIVEQVGLSLKYDDARHV